MNRNSTRSVQRTPPLHAGPRAIPMQDSSSQLNRGGGGYRGRHADSDGEGAGVAAGASSATAGGGGDDGNDMSDDNYSPPVRGPPGRGRGRQHSTDFLRFGDGDVSAGVSREGVGSLLRRILSHAVPMTLVLALELSLNIITLGWVSNSSNDASLAGVGLAMAWSSVTVFGAYAVVHGVHDQVVQALKSGDDYAVGYTVQRGVVVSTLAAICVFPLWFFAEAIMIVFHQDRAVSAACGQFLRYALPGLWPLLVFHVLRQQLKALHIVWPLVAIGAVINVMHFYMTDMYIFGVAGWRGLGFAGTGLALATSRTLLLFFLFLYMLASRQVQQYWGGCSVEALRPSPLGTFVASGLKHGLMELFETIGFELGTILAGYVSVPTLAAQGIVAVTYTSTTVLMKGWGLAANKLIAESVRAGDAEQAKRTAILCCVVGWTCGILGGGIVLGIRIPLTRWFDTPEVVFGDTTQAFAVAALCLLMDVCAFTGRGVLLGIERKGRGGIVYLVAEYAAGLPTLLILVFVAHQGVEGVWEARIATLLVAGIGVGVLLCRLSWEHEAGRAQKHTFVAAAPSRSTEAPLLLSEESSATTGFVQL